MAWPVGYVALDSVMQTWPSARVLDTLRHECVEADFFLIGQNAMAHPELARRELADGHTVAYHTYSHPLLDRMPIAAAEAEIDRGFVMTDVGDSPNHRQLMVEC